MSATVPHSCSCGVNIANFRYERASEEETTMLQSVQAATESSRCSVEFSIQRSLAFLCKSCAISRTCAALLFPLSSPITTFCHLPPAHPATTHTNPGHPHNHLMEGGCGIIIVLGGFIVCVGILF